LCPGINDGEGGDILTGNILEISTTFDSFLDPDTYEVYQIEDVSATRGNIYDASGSDDYGRYLFEMYFTFQCTLTVTTERGETITETHTLIYDDNPDGGHALDGSTAIVLKNDTTAPFFPSSYDLRTQSIDRQLQAAIEEVMARREATKQKSET